MKTKLFFLLAFFFFGVSQAQIIDFADSDFKDMLLTKNCVSFDFVYNGINNSEIPHTSRNADLNGNGEIEVSEVEQVKLISFTTDVPKLINSIDEIKFFKNLYVLSMIDQHISDGNLDLSGLSNLKELICFNSNISSINLTGVSLDLILARQNHITSFDFNAQNQLRYFDFAENQNFNSGNISLKDMPNLYQFTLDNCNISSLNITNVPKLEGFNINYNPLPNLDLSQFTYFQYLGIAGTGRTSLDVSNFQQLTSLNCSGNNLQNLDVSKNVALTYLNCSFDSLTNIDVSKNVNLAGLIFQGNLVTSIDLSKNINLSLLDANDNNNLSVLNLNNNSALKTLFCSSTNLIDLDLSNNKALEFLQTGNTSFNYLNLKNGKHITFLFNNNLSNSNIKYLCCDNENIDYYKQQLQYLNITPEINSYCSFNPGGNHNTISGNVKLDSNQNGCDMSDNNFSKLKIKISKDNQDLGTTSTNLNGNYQLFTDAGNFTITPVLENLDYYTVSPSSATVNFADVNNNTFTQNFCVIPKGKHNDLEVQLAPVNQARPGFEATYRFVYLNKGNTTLSGNVNLDYQGNKISFVSSELPPDTNINSNLVWNFIDLKPFEQKSFIVTFRLNAPTHATDPLNSGDKLTFTAKIFPINNDETPKDNNLVLHQTVVNSLDPNDKTCLEGDVITPDLVGNNVHYLIRFENVGTANAVNVVVKDMIDTAKFDVESLQPIKSSHPYRMTITEGNKVEFFFENIQLPYDDSNNDGYILFKIKTKPTLVVGDTFSNKADIYFDYNFPIATNEAITTVQSNLSTQEISKSEISIYPNPAKEILTFKTKEKVKKAEIYDVNGRLIKVELGISNNQIDVSSLKTGTYVIKAISDKKYYQAKFIKQ